MKSEGERTSTGMLPGRRFVTGIGWNVVATACEQSCSLVAFLILARILGPEDFGVVILAVALIDVMISFVLGGVNEALIRTPSLSEPIITTGFWLNVGISIVIATVIYLLAPTFGDIIGVPDTVPLLQVLTLVFPLVAIGAIAEALLARRMEFATLARRQVLSSVGGACVAITFALLGYGVWAMVFQRLATFTISAALAIWAANLRPGLTFSLELARDLINFGTGITSVNLLYRLQPRVADVMIGFLSQPAAVASFRAAYRVVDLFSQLPMQPVMRVVFPLFGRLSSDSRNFTSVLLRLMEGLQLFLLPGYALLMYLSADIFNLLFGVKWENAITPFVLLLLATSIRLPFVLIGPAVSAKGSVKVTASFTAADVGLNIVLMALAAPWGITAIAGSRILGSILLWPIGMRLLFTHAGLSFGDVLLTLRRPLCVTVTLLMAVYFLDYIIDQGNDDSIRVLNFIACVVVYALLIPAACWRSVSEFVALINNSRSPLTQEE